MQEQGWYLHYFAYCVLKVYTNIDTGSEDTKMWNTNKTKLTIADITYTSNIWTVDNRGMYVSLLVSANWFIV